MRVCAVWVAIVPATCTFIYTLHPHTTHVRRLARCMRSRKRPPPSPPSPLPQTRGTQESAAVDGADSTGCRREVTSHTHVRDVAHVHNAARHYPSPCPALVEAGHTQHLEHLARGARMSQRGRGRLIACCHTSQRMRQHIPLQPPGITLKQCTVWRGGTAQKGSGHIPPALRYTAVQTFEAARVPANTSAGREADQATRTTHTDTRTDRHSRRGEREAKPLRRYGADSHRSLRGSQHCSPAMHRQAATTPCLLLPLQQVAARCHRPQPPK
jgi:hypothetical protein